ncbi:exosortase family protein XrtF [Chryseobacterium sp. SNU WT5]|uniref:exosortase family protein XrtF n=1 Tax=Chryseobacterium sp. SNU WT5 TaxID=2594269 RepID=UPI00117CC63C|nr:exosortase family protein XrtF [Chryseobacterium sp. SNU WT5]QDP85503.1 exosortase family protein XrtF [Chryseobacterium sp. SNU WT5]
MFSDFKPVLKILLRFIILYVVMVLLYQFYLNEYKNAGLDPFSGWVMGQSNFLQNFFGYSSQMVEGNPQDETTWFYLNETYVSRMVEGCNAISVMILFVAFIFAFYEGVKTFVFSILGLVVLHIINVLRIVGLNVVILEHPTYSKMAHDYFFPAIIYGTVVFLWLVWIKFFAIKTSDHENI